MLNKNNAEPIFKQLNILPLPSLIEYFKLQFMQFFIQCHKPPSYLNNSYLKNKEVYKGRRSTHRLF